MESRLKEQSRQRPRLRAATKWRNCFSTFRHSHRYLCIQRSNYRTDLIARRDTEVGPGSCKIAHSYGRMVARNVSSELLLVIYADKCKLGKMLRFSNDTAQVAFAETALELFFKELPALGMQKSDLRVHLIGGVTATTGCFAYMRRLLRSANISLAGQDLATDQSRSIWLVLDSGHLIVRSSTHRTSAICTLPDQLAS
jgi:chemotaxis receptor (MCP) glutamine deamidase CheD